jgi:hypothetical protein
MDGGFDNIFCGRTVMEVNGQPMVIIAILTIYIIGGGIIYHNKKFLASLNMWGRKELLTPLNGKGHNLM